MRARHVFFFAMAAILTSAVMFQNRVTARGSSIDTDLAYKYFQEARSICDRDKGRLWGVELCGPVLFVDAGTRELVANQSDAKGLLSRNGRVFTGRLPDEENCANTATTWAGVKWSMMLWPLPEDAQDRARLMTHESFHRIQNELGLPASNPSNDHLDSLEGRIWLQMEWRALKASLRSEGSARRQAIADALTFRSHRHSLFPNSDSSERGLEMNEGLAEYTGQKLSAQSVAQLIESIIRGIENAANRPTFVRSFAYISGPAYGVLLDFSGASWRKGLKSDNDLGDLLMKAHGIKLPAGLKEVAVKRAAKYDGEALRQTETERNNARLKRIAEYRARLIDGPTLLIPLTENVNYSFNPNNLVPIEGAGTVYPTLRVTDDWGILEVSNGALMVREGGKVTKVYVPSPKDSTAQPLTGDGWTLKTNSGWTVIPGQSKGNFLLKRAE